MHLHVVLKIKEYVSVVVSNTGILLKTKRFSQNGILKIIKEIFSHISPAEILKLTELTFLQE